MTKLLSITLRTYGKGNNTACQVTTVMGWVCRFTFATFESHESVINVLRDKINENAPRLWRKTHYRDIKKYRCQKVGRTVDLTVR